MGGDAPKKQDTIYNLAEMTKEAEESSDIRYNNKAAWYRVSGYCTFYNSSDNSEARPMYYLACPVCKKKVNDEGTGYRCETCSKSFGEAVPTYNFSFMLSDYTSKITVSCLGEAGEAVLGQPATVMMSMGADDVKLIT
jgi:hypothetical protein